MNIFFTILSVLMLVFVVWQGRIVVPRIISFLLPIKKNLYFEDGQRAPEKTDKTPGIAAVVSKLESAGFAPLGMMVEKFPLWAAVTREIIMVSPGSQAIASLGFRRQRPSYFFYTPFAGGEVVITACNSFRDLKKAGFVTEVIPSGDVAEMLAAHSKRVEEFVQQGYIPFTDFSRESVIRATDQYYNSPYLKQQLRIAGILNLLFLVVCLFLLAILTRSALS